MPESSWRWQLSAGTLEHCKNHYQGHHKIQDVWSSKVYEIVSCCDKVGTLYKIRFREMEGPIKVMHRSEFKLVPSGRGAPSQSICSTSAASSSEEVGSQPQVAVIHTRIGVKADASPQSDGQDDLSGILNDICPGGNTVVPMAVQPEIIPDLAPAVVDAPDQLSDEAGMSDFALRRTTRRTAGQHPNPFHLPQAVVQNPTHRVQRLVQ